MSLEREAVEHSAERNVMNGGVDPFAIAAGLIVAILIASLLLWLNGGAEISSSSYGYAIDTFPEVALPE